MLISLFPPKEPELTPSPAANTPTRFPPTEMLQRRAEIAWRKTARQARKSQKPLQHNGNGGFLEVGPADPAERYFLASPRTCFAMRSSTALTSFGSSSLKKA